MMAGMRSLGWMTVIFLLLAGHPAAAQEKGNPPEGDVDPRAGEILSRLDARLGSIDSLEGAFVQTFVSSGLGVPQSEEGRFFIKRPDLMRWEYRKPEEKLAVSDGTNTWLYLPQEKTVYKGTVKQWKEGGAFAVLAGGSLVDEFTAIGVGVEGASRSGDVLIRLKPRSPREQFEFLNLQFDPETLSIHMITAIDGMGNRVSLILSGVRENGLEEGDRFEFTPPRGAQVIDQAAPATPADIAGPGRGGR